MKTHHIKRIVCAILSVLMMVSVISVPVMAEEIPAETTAIEGEISAEAAAIEEEISVEADAGTEEEAAMSEASADLYEADPVTSFVKRLYKLVLGRDADAAGLKNWVNNLKAKKITGADAAHGFLFSDEYLKKKTSNSSYVETLYTTLMNRASDAAGKKSWTDLLANGLSRTYVFRGFVESKEFTNLCASYGIERGEATSRLTEPRDQNANVTQFVARCYTLILNRKWDVAGLNDWCNRLLTGNISADELAYGFVFSKEFIKRGFSNENYVEILYKTFLNRASDSTGKKDWVARLKGGVTRYDVFYGFVYSKEFASICKKYGIAVGNHYSSDHSNINYDAVKAYRQFLSNNNWIHQYDGGQKTMAVFDLNQDGIMEAAVIYEGTDWQNYTTGLLSYHNGLIQNLIYSRDNGDMGEPIEMINESAGRYMMGRTRGKGISTFMQLNADGTSTELGSFFPFYFDVPNMNLDPSVEAQYNAYMKGMKTLNYVTISETSLANYLSGQGKSTGTK